VPFSVACDPGSLQGEVCGRANTVPGVAIYPSNKTNAEWFNPAAFAAPSTYVLNGVTYDPYGTSGYNLLRGPRFEDWDMSLQKNLPLGERYHLTLRADSFNIFNHPSFGTPNNDISNPSAVGQITSMASNYEPRTVEFGLKFNF
jgi:hypothetical protein